MAINKKLIHFDLFSDFSSKKLSANKENTKYTLGVDGAVTNGSPDILWHSICWIKDAQKMWTHGRLYDCSSVEEALAMLESTKSKAGAYVTVGVTTKGGNVDSVTLDETKLSNALDSKASTSYVDRGLSTKADTTAIPTKTSQLTNDSGYITSVAKGTATTQATAQTLMCDVNINGKTVTPVKFNGTVGSSTMPVYMAGGKPTPITSFGEANLSWGGKNITNGYGPIDASLVGVLRANRFDGLPAECVTVEYSRDGGATWLDYGATDKQKVDMVSQTADNAALVVGKGTTSSPADGNSRLRIIINSLKSETATYASVYTELNKFILYITTYGSKGPKCTIRWRKQRDYVAGNDVWTVAAESVPISGWSGYNVINTSNITIGIGDDHARQIAFEFSISSHDVGADGSYNGMRVEKLFAYGGVGWVTPSNMAARGHLYSYDYQQNAKFPAKVNAIGGLQENGTNLSSKYLGINATANSAKYISDGTTTIIPSDIKTMETNLEDIISDVVSIDTSLFPTSTDEVIGFRQTNGGDGVGYSEAWLDRLKGNTVVWNQLARPLDVQNYETLSTNHSTLSFNNGVAKLTITASPTSVTQATIRHKDGRGIKSIAGQKYIYIYSLKASAETTIYFSRSGSSRKIGINWADYVIFATPSTSNDSSLQYIGAYDGTPVGTIIECNRIQVFNLTQMFGAGNEPTTIEEFNARKPLGVSDAYNEGELISTTADELKSVGFNAWDEEWELGSFNSEGNPISYAGCIRTKNSIRILPNTSYYLKSKNKWLVVFFFDDQGNLIKSAEYRDTAVITPPNAHYMKFRTDSSYGNTYNHDICIHLVHTGTRNGQYEPYKEYRLPLPIKDIKDKDGNQLFPNGLLSAGTAYDEITATKAIKRIGVVDMGTLLWGYNPSTLRFYCNFKKHGVGIANVVCPKYSTDNIAIAEKDKTITSSDAYEAIYVKDSSYTSAATFKAAMSGVMLYYELAEPIEVDIEEWDRRYEVSDFGTEEVISDTPTAPLKADIIYEYNAKGRIEANERGIEELNDKIAEINEKVGEMNGLSISSDKIWSDENPVDITLGDVDNDAFLPEGYGLAGGQSRVARMYVKFTSTDTTYEGEFLSSYNDNCLIIGAKGYYQLEAPNGTILKRGYVGDSFVKVEQIGTSGWKFNFSALDMEEGMKVHVGAMLDCIDID